jgi:hypothetical protein
MGAGDRKASNSRHRRKSPGESGMEDDHHRFLLHEDSHHGDEHHHHSWRDLKGDYGNIAVLTFLYVLQGTVSQAYFALHEPLHKVQDF